MKISTSEETRRVCTFSSLVSLFTCTWSLHPCWSCTSSDELALLFTGAKASATQHKCNTSATQVQLSDEIEDEDNNGNLSPSLRVETETEDGQSTPLPSEDSQASQAVTQAVSAEMISSTSFSTHTSEIHPNLLSPLVNCPPHPLFATEQLGVDRRLIVNRKRQLKMYRVWMQGKFRKL